MPLGKTDESSVRIELIIPTTKKWKKNRILQCNSLEYFKKHLKRKKNRNNFFCHLCSCGIFEEKQFTFFSRFVHLINDQIKLVPMLKEFMCFFFFFAFSSIALKYCI